MWLHGIPIHNPKTPFKLTNPEPSHTVTFPVTLNHSTLCNRLQFSLQTNFTCWKIIVFYCWSGQICPYFGWYFHVRAPLKKTCRLIQIRPFTVAPPSADSPKLHPPPILLFWWRNTKKIVQVHPGRFPTTLMVAVTTIPYLHLHYTRKWPRKAAFRSLMTHLVWVNQFTEETVLMEVLF